jgi:uroporphyrinogen decarboxylase
MTGFSHRDRVLAALNHEPTDRVPIDFGGTFVSTIWYSAYEKLKEELGIATTAKAANVSPTRRLAVVEPEVQDRFDVDTRYLALGQYEGDQKVIDEDTYFDEWGVTWRKSGEGPYLYVDGPFFGIKKPDIALLDDYDWPDPDNPGYTRGLAERAAALRQNSDHAIILNMPVGIVHNAQFVRGFAESLTDLYKNREFLERLYGIITDWYVRVASNAMEAVGDNIDIVFMGDDLASQQATMFDPEIYRAMIKPHQRRIMEVVKGYGQPKILYHSCGAVAPLIEDLIEIGVDALNPVQVTAKGMEPAGLKEAFGDRIAFWGGISTQKALPFGTPDEVRADVRHIIDCLGKDGGYVLNSVHNLQSDVPPKNIIAMFDEARVYC